MEIFVIVLGVVLSVAVVVWRSVMSYIGGDGEYKVEDLDDNNSVQP